MDREKRFYLDFNSTSPLANKVNNFLAQGDFYFANPSSIHQSGKAARKAINDAILFLFDFFGLNENEFNIIFHSGATEGNNSLLQGFVNERGVSKACLIYHETDHPSIVNTADALSERGFLVKKLRFSSESIQSLSQIEDVIRENQDRDYLLCLTWVHNETGLVLNLEDFVKLKVKYPQLSIHVDAVQAPGKIPQYKKLEGEIDSYTFSGHKFGSLKGIGFSFIKKKLKIAPLLYGGSQQRSSRPGTENTLGVVTLKFALEELHQNSDINKLSEAHQFLYEGLAKILKGKGEIPLPLDLLGKKKNLNTIFFYMYDYPSDFMLNLFDRHGIEISQGSACSSGTSRPSLFLERMSLEKYAKNGLRLSHSCHLKLAEAENILSAMKIVLDKI